MADLRDREVAVSDKNDTRMGPSGRRARSADSFYLLVGGSRDTYNVTVNFESKNGHWCETLAGKRCHGNGNGKGQKYGPPQGRDKRLPPTRFATATRRRVVTARRDGPRTTA